jgi:hypothetical protein
MGGGKDVGCGSGFMGNGSVDGAQPRVAMVASGERTVVIWAFTSVCTPGRAESPSSICKVDVTLCVGCLSRLIGRRVGGPVSRNLTRSGVVDTTMGEVLMVVPEGDPVVEVNAMALEAKAPARPCTDGISIQASFAAGSTSSDETVSNSRARSERSG